jgi:hypothetical protein
MKQTIFALFRQKNPDMYLGCYLGEALPDSKEEVTILASTPLDEAHRDALSLAMFNDIDFSVDRWIMDKRYIPRLLVCALVFLLSYFFFSLVIRDPIPIIDELAFSTIITLFVWRFASKRDTQCVIAQKLRSELKKQASNAQVSLSKELFAVESFMDECDLKDKYELGEEICHHKLKLTVKTEGFKEQLLEYARVHSKDTYLMYQQVSEDTHHQILSAKISDLLLQKKLDGSLLALLVAVCES